ncbi:MAG TPA: phosphoribosylanthranilate isomerase [Candidatus Dormibacteraeota bacterium]|nr:phosphoribosylanthranilate isomerase [Candidatus Dormibacteraeota bacterium]
MTRVKICGVTRLADALHAARAGADAIGLNFHPGSPRRVSLATAAAIAAALPAGVCTVGVFVDAGRDEIAAVADRVGLDAIQFHGDESTALCGGWSRKTIKAVRVDGPQALAAAAAYPVDYLLADAHVVGQPGGTGRRVPLEWLVGVPSERLILAGGLTPETVAAAVRAVHPAAVDVASGVESAPGIKDPEKVERFIANARTA